MLDRQECIDRIGANADYIISQFDVSTLRLFGSLARNQQKESSDVDVFVEMPPGHVPIDRFKTIPGRIAWLSCRCHTCPS